MEGFITFLFFFVLFMWVMRKLFPILLAWFVKRRIEKGGFGYGSFGYGGFQQQQRQQQQKEEGKVVISDIPKQDKVIDKEVGEYIDFEEK